MYKFFKSAIFFTLFSVCTSTLFSPAITDAAKTVDAQMQQIQKIAWEAQKYEAAKKAILYYDKEGRDKLFTELQQKDGVNTNHDYNNILKSVITRMTTAINTIDPTVNAPPYNFFVNNMQSFGGYCSLGHNLSVNTGLFVFCNNNEEYIAAAVASLLVMGQKKYAFNDILKQSTATFLKKTKRKDKTTQTYPDANTQMQRRIEDAGDVVQYMALSEYNIGAPAALQQRLLENSLNYILTDSRQVRDRFAEIITLYSNEKVSVNSDTGEILIKGQLLLAPSKTTDFSGKERSYLVAGTLAGLYNKDKNLSAEAYTTGNTLMLGTARIMNCGPNDPPAAELAAKLNNIK